MKPIKAMAFTKEMKVKFGTWSSRVQLIVVAEQAEDVKEYAEKSGWVLDEDIIDEKVEEHVYEDIAARNWKLLLDK